MTLAGDLARAGRAVTVLERRPTIHPSSRAFVTMPRTLEVLDSRGLADDLLADANTIEGVHLFAGATLDLTHLPSRHRYGMITPQTNVDQALERYARDQGAQVLRDTEVTGLAQDADAVTVTARPHGGGPVSTWRARYVVGADGTHSTVRDLLGADFPGKTVLSSVVLADVRLTDGPAGNALTLGNTRHVFGFLVPYGKARPGWYRSMTWDRRQLPDNAPVEEAEVIRVLAEAMGSDAGVREIGWHSRFHCDERQVRSYRQGRVFLAGDAAHVHSPMGGQGMNTGIQDAANLAWKLDLALGGADPAILDTCHRERHPIGRRVLRQSGAMMPRTVLTAGTPRGGPGPARRPRWRTPGAERRAGGDATAPGGRPGAAASPSGPDHISRHRWSSVPLSSYCTTWALLAVDMPSTPSTFWLFLLRRRNQPSPLSTFLQR